MKESDVINIIKKELAVETLDLDIDGNWDSLDLIQILISLDVAFGEDKLKDIRELQTVKTPRNIIDILKQHGLID